uniref:Mammalian ependymin-related protein 1 n=2 Tax=Magallana gigas TaxID=29159 RepID=A0A8W8K0C4_MAGGI|nr:uncharacterized protein LOC105326484 [Crassostrea gigas]
MQRLACLFVLFAAVVGQENTCCPPPQWEASIRAKGVAFNPLLQTYETTQKVYLDEINGKFVHTVDADFEQTGKYQYTVFEDYRKAKRYLLVNGHCTISDLTEEFNREWCVSPANFLRNETFGIGDQSFVLQYFKVERDLTTYNLNGHSLVTRLSDNRCVIHQEMIDLFSKADPPTRSIRVSFVVHDMKDTISDNSVFDIPKACRGAQGQKNRQKRSTEDCDEVCGVEKAVGTIVYP